MLISEMIAKLQKLERRFGGDMQLVVEIQRGCMESPPSDFVIRYIPSDEDASDDDVATIRKTSVNTKRVLYADMRDPSGW